MRQVEVSPWYPNIVLFHGHKKTIIVQLRSCNMEGWSWSDWQLKQIRCQHFCHFLPIFMGEVMHYPKSPDCTCLSPKCVLKRTRKLGTLQHRGICHSKPSSFRAVLFCMVLLDLKSHQLPLSILVGSQPIWTIWLFFPYFPTAFHPDHLSYISEVRNLNENHVFFLQKHPQPAPHRPLHRKGRPRDRSRGRSAEAGAQADAQRQGGAHADPDADTWHWMTLGKKNGIKIKTEIKLMKWCWVFEVFETNLLTSVKTGFWRSELTGNLELECTSTNFRWLTFFQIFV